MDNLNTYYPKAIIDVQADQTSLALRAPLLQSGEDLTQKDFQSTPLYQILHFFL